VGALGGDPSVFDGVDVANLSTAGTGAYRY
jgi:hypothetical protein